MQLNVSELPRNKISGQDSGEIRPKRQFTNTFRYVSISSYHNLFRNYKMMAKNKQVAYFCRTQPTDNATQSPDNKEVQQEDEKTTSLLPDKTHEHEKVEGNAGNTTVTLSTEEIFEGMEDVSVSVSEDSTSFLSELHGADGSEFVGVNMSSEGGELDSGGTPEKSGYGYDPSGWTPMEIEAATGSSECTTMEHPLRLRSTYSEVEVPIFLFLFASNLFILKVNEFL